MCSMQAVKCKHAQCRQLTSSSLMLSVSLSACTAWQHLQRQLNSTPRGLLPLPGTSGACPARLCTAHLPARSCCISICEDLPAPEHPRQC